jgi:hypothetical protein
MCTCFGNRNVKNNYSISEINKLELYETASVKRFRYRCIITKFLKVGKEAAVLPKVSHKASQEDDKFQFIQLNCLINTRWFILD